MAEQLHKGHRKRMRKRIEEGGIENLNEHEVLEYLLYSFVPRKDTNALAHKLLDEFGSLCQVMGANPKHLQKVVGMTENASLFLSVLPEIFRQYVVSAKHKKIKRILANPEEVKDYMGGFFIGLNEERVYAVALDIKNRIIGEKEWKSGKRSSVDVTHQQIYEFADKSKAVSVLIAHNHPGGGVFPSGDDIALTERIWRILHLMGFTLQDHLIFNDVGECYSFKQNGYFDDWKGEPVY